MLEIKREAYFRKKKERLNANNICENDKELIENKKRRKDGGSKHISQKPKK